MAARVAKPQGQIHPLLAHPRYPFGTMRPILIAGGGIGGIATALCLRARGIAYVNSRFCEDAEGARAMRRKILASCAESGAVFAPAHWGPPHAGRIESNAANFELKWA